jgi:hypothetical protein
MTPEQLVEIPGIGGKMVEKIHQSVAAYFQALETQAVAPEIVPEEGVLEEESGIVEGLEEAQAVETSPEAAAAEGEQEAAEESAEASELTEATAGEEAAEEAAEEQGLAGAAEDVVGGVSEDEQRGDAAKS